MNNVSAAAYIYILRILYVILSNQQNLNLRENFRVDQEIERYDFFKNLEDDQVSTK
jgi:hypothetical protein